MNKPEIVTGEWIKEQIEKTKATFQANSTKQSFNSFVLNDSAIKFTHTLNELRKMCPHKYKNNICIYCKNIKGDE